MPQSLAQLMQTKRWVYYLDEDHPGEERGTFRVSVVVEDEPGHFPTGNPTRNTTAWYWSKETCRQRNQSERDVSEEEERKIVVSSMFPAPS